MKKSLLNSPNTHYTVGEHLGFNQDVVIICEKYKIIIDEPQFIQTYADKIKQEEEIFKWMRGNHYTEKKAKADYKRADTYMGMTGVVRAGRRHFDPPTRNAAIRIYNFLMSYGDVAHSNYTAETVNINSIVERLQSDLYAQSVARLGLTPWINRLKYLNQQFEKFEAAATEENMKKPHLTAKESRKQTDAALHNITARVESLANLNGINDYLGFIDEFNARVQVYNRLVHEHYGRTHVKIDVGDAMVEPIEPMTYTGKPVFVIPIVKLRKMENEKEVIVDLVFTKDFSILVKNNIERGMATINIRGIGKYKGQVIATFYID